MSWNLTLSEQIHRLCRGVHSAAIRKSKASKARRIEPSQRLTPNGLTLSSDLLDESVELLPPNRSRHNSIVNNRKRVNAVSR
jgi:hypothetical protein